MILPSVFAVARSADYRDLAPQIIASVPADVLAARIAETIATGSAAEALNAAELPYYLSGAGLVFGDEALETIDLARHRRLLDQSLPPRTRTALTAMVLPGYRP